MNYLGSGPYCYANSLAMILGSSAPDPSAIEVLTGSPFGVNLLGGTIPFFDPKGWDPSIGIDAALECLGWVCDRWSGGTAADAKKYLLAVCRNGPVLTGPLEMGLLLHHPGSGRAIGSDHYVVVLAADDQSVQMHDPHGYPYATLPIETFIAAWEADSIEYAKAPFSMRFDFREVRRTTVNQALSASIPEAVRWLTVESDGNHLAGADALDKLAEQIDLGLESKQHQHLIWFAIRAGARRLADAGRWLREIGLIRPSEMADRQAQLLGSVQHSLVVHDAAGAADALRKLAPCYEELRLELSR